MDNRGYKGALFVSKRTHLTFHGFLQPQPDKHKQLCSHTATWKTWRYSFCTLSQQSSTTKPTVLKTEEEEMYLQNSNWMYEIEPVKHHFELSCWCIDQVVYFFVVMYLMKVIKNIFYLLLLRELQCWLWKTVLYAGSGQNNPQNNRRQYTTG